RAQPSPAGTEVRIDGERLAGSLSIPDADGAPITGRFSRVSWKMPARRDGANTRGAPAKPASTAGTTAGTTAVAAPADAGAGFDPSSVPPLAIDIDDLRFGDLALGKAELRTRPVPAGLRIERLQARSKQQQV